MTPPAPFDAEQTLSEALLTPTKIYVQEVLPPIRDGLILAAAHITGGGLPENLPRALPDGLTSRLTANQPRPAVFDWLQEAGGLSDADMARAFNNGVGYVLIVRQADRARALERFEPLGGYALGDVVEE